ncbi:MAG: LutC/YkgG family protein [Acidimicrobiales bacterium]
MSDARAEVLARIAAALGRPGIPAPRVDPRELALRIERRYRRAGAGPGGDPPPAGSGAAGGVPPAWRAALVAAFVERASEHGAVVQVLDDPAQLATAVARRAGPGSVLVPAGLDRSWLAGLGGARDDEPGLTMAELATVEAAVTGCALAIAETGTIVLDHGADQGRRALTLVPDHHVCVVGDHQIVAAVPDAVAALDPSRVLTWVSGPSATSDIELERVVGVHGPRRLDIIVVAGTVPSVIAR